MAPRSRPIRLRGVTGACRRFGLLLMAATVLNSCQSLMDQTYQPNVSPSANPQIVSEVQKNDPRAQMGAREHPRIVASYGGEIRLAAPIARFLAAPDLPALKRFLQI